jgi:hypothetical protein
MSDTHIIYITREFNFLKFKGFSEFLVLLKFNVTTNNDIMNRGQILMRRDLARCSNNAKTNQEVFNVETELQ